MSYYKRNRRGGGPGQRPPEAPAVSESARILRGEEFNLREEVDHIVELASEGETRTVTAGALVFLSTDEGDAWVLDVEDNLALCLMREFERCDVEIHEDPKTFAIRWDSTFAIEGGCFLGFAPARKRRGGAPVAGCAADEERGLSELSRFRA